MKLIQEKHIIICNGNLPVLDELNIIEFEYRKILKLHRVEKIRKTGATGFKYECYTSNFAEKKWGNYKEEIFVSTFVKCSTVLVKIKVSYRNFSVIKKKKK